MQVAVRASTADFGESDETWEDPRGRGRRGRGGGGDGGGRGRRDGQMEEKKEFQVWTFAVHRASWLPSWACDPASLSGIIDH